MSINKITFCLLSALSLNTLAADTSSTKTNKYITAQLKSCLASAPSSKAVVKTLECLAENTELWNNEISARIEVRKAKQSDAQNAVLDEAQSTWVAHRDEKFRSFEEDIASEPTSEKIVEFAKQELRLVKKRALEF